MRTELVIALTMSFSLLVLLFSSLVIAACGGPDFMDKTRIDGSVLRGTPVLTDDQLFGRTVFIAKNFSIDPTNPAKFIKFGLCSGVIIDDQHILTAAHCTANIKESRLIFTENVNQPLMLSQVYQIIDYRIPAAFKKAIAYELAKAIQPGPENQSHSYDVAVLKLDRPIPYAKFNANYFNEMDSLTSLTTHKKIEADALIAGYGRISDYNKLQEDPDYTAHQALTGTLMKAKLQLSLEELSQRTIIRNQKSSSGVCAGDSGAPLFTVRGEDLYLQAIAIATFKLKSEDLNNTYNACFGKSIYLNLDFFKNWISEAIRAMDKSKSNQQTN